MNRKQIIAILIVGMLAVGCATLTPEEKQQKALRDSVVGEYSYSYGGLVPSLVSEVKLKLVLLENGVYELYSHDNNFSNAELKWSIENKEIHLMPNPRVISVFRINKDGSITAIAAIIDGKREDGEVKSHQTYKKIK